MEVSAAQICSTPLMGGDCSRPLLPGGCEAELPLPQVRACALRRARQRSRGLLTQAAAVKADFAVGSLVPEGLAPCAPSQCPLPPYYPPDLSP